MYVHTQTFKHSSLLHFLFRHILVIVVDGIPFFNFTHFVCEINSTHRYVHHTCNRYIHGKFIRMCIVQLQVFECAHICMYEVDSVNYVRVVCACFAYVPVCDVSLLCMQHRYQHATMLLTWTPTTWILPTALGLAPVVTISISNCGKVQTVV